MAGDLSWFAHKPGSHGPLGPCASDCKKRNEKTDRPCADRACPECGYFRSRRLNVAMFNEEYPRPCTRRHTK